MQNTANQITLVLVQSPFMTLSQKIRWAYSTTLPQRWVRTDWLSVKSLGGELLHQRRRIDSPKVRQSNH